MKTSSAKSKGRELQKHAAKRIKEVFDLPEEDVVSRPMGSSGIDIMLSRRALDHFPFSAECKNSKTFPSVAALEQSKYNRKKGTWPCVIWKPPRKGFEKSIIYFELEDFLNFLQYQGGVADKDDEIEKPPIIKPEIKRLKATISKIVERPPFQFDFEGNE